MPSRESEVFVLRSYPYREADLIVSCFSRDRGKLRGVARGVRRPKSRFGSSLERLAYSKLFYFQKDTLELVRLDRAELIGPPVLLQADYPTSIALDLIAETAEQLLPEQEPNDAHFRLLKLVLEEFWRGLREEPGGEKIASWAERALIYYLLWAIRLGGWLPPLNRCIESGKLLTADQTVYFSRSKAGLVSVEFKDRDSWRLAPRTRALATRMLQANLAEVELEQCDAVAACELRRFLVQRAEAQFDGRLRSATALDALG